MRQAVWENLTEAERAACLSRAAVLPDGERRHRVSEILSDVRKRGDTAVREWTKRFDGCDVADILVPAADIERAWTEIAAGARKAMESAAARITAFHQSQLPQPVIVETAPGVRCERRFVSLETVGLYAPGGSAPLISTVLMLGIPARLAGCARRVLATPPDKDGVINAHMLAAARLAGITDVVRAGGAQAIAALAYGTVSVPKADKIFGPGNAWVAEAKHQAAQDPHGAICDLPAGPSEVFVIADDSADPAFVASDLLAQAEHGEDSQVFLATPSADFITKVLTEVQAQLKTLPRQAIARACLAHSFALRTRDLAQALELANRYAPEHLIFQTRDDEALAAQVRNAGAVFLGPWAPEAAGDYASGPNHVLPTAGSARFCGGLGVESFLKPMTFQRLTREGLKAIASDVETLAGLEKLDAHKRSVSVRKA